MSRKIYKKTSEPVSSPFQFQPSHGPGMPMPISLEAEAELDAFNDPVHQSAPKFTATSSPAAAAPPGAGQVDVQAIIARAQEDADQIIQGAQQRAAETEREAYEKGLAEGRKTGEIMADQQLQAMMHHYNHTVQALDGARQLMLYQLQLDIVDLVVHTAQKVVKSELQQNPSAILAMAKDAIQNLKQRKDIIIYFNGDDHQYIQQLSQQEQHAFLGTQVQLEIDPQLGRGDIRIEAVSGELDARVQTQLDAMRTELRQALEAQ